MESKHETFEDVVKKNRALRKELQKLIVGNLRLKRENDILIKTLQDIKDYRLDYYEESGDCTMRCYADIALSQVARSRGEK